jgi:hypothetical protein
MPLDKGGRQGTKNGYGAKAGQQAAHAAKGSDPMQQATDNYTIDPDTGDVYDPNGDYVAYAGDYVGGKR